MGAPVGRNHSLFATNRSARAAYPARTSPSGRTRWGRVGETSGMTIARTGMSGAREYELIEAANLLLNARRTGVAVEDLPAGLRPATLSEAYFVQDTMAAAYEEIGGWKVGAATAEATPAFAPMPKAWIAASGAALTDLPGSKKW